MRIKCFSEARGVFEEDQISFEPQMYCFGGGGGGGGGGGSSMDSMDDDPDTGDFGVDTGSGQRGGRDDNDNDNRPAPAPAPAPVLLLPLPLPLPLPVLHLTWMPRRSLTSTKRLLILVWDRRWVSCQIRIPRRLLRGPRSPDLISQDLAQDGDTWGAWGCRVQRF
jgi:hypothetical protein